jgi:hypothetical protein
VLYLAPATARALQAYQARYCTRFPSRSVAGEHLLVRALLGENGGLDEGLEGVLAPLLERRVAAAAGQVVRQEISTLLRAQTDRLAALLVRSGKDARMSATLSTAILEQLTGDRAFARRLAEEAHLAAGQAYTARGLHAAGED